MSNRAPVTSEDTAGAPAPLEPGSLIAGPTPGYYVIGPTGSAIALADLTDVQLGALVDEDFFQYDSGTGKWVNVAKGSSPWVLKSGDTMTGGLVLAAGTTLPGTAPLTVPSGPLMLTPEAGAVERLVDKLYFTITGALRKPLALWDASGTAGRIPYTTTDGRLADSAALAWNKTANQLNVGVQYKFVVQPDYAGNGDIPANSVLIGSSDNWLAFFANTTSGQVGDGVIFGYYNGGAVKSAMQIANTTGGTAGTLALMKGGGAVEVGGSLKVGTSGTAITQTRVYTPSLTPALVSAGAPVEQTFAVTGLSTSDTISVNAPGMAIFSARVSAPDTLALTFFPPTLGSYTPPANAYRIIAHRS